MHESTPPRSASGEEFYHSVLTIADGIATKEPLAPALPVELTEILTQPPPAPVADGWLRLARRRLKTARSV